MSESPALEAVRTCVRAARDKKAEDALVLDLRPLASFTDYFVLLTGSSARQIHAVCDAIREQLREAGLRPAHVEGYQQAEWVVLDYIDFVVHVFSPAKRRFYQLERLWEDAESIEIPEAAA